MEYPEFSEFGVLAKGIQCEFSANSANSGNYSISLLHVIFGDILTGRSLIRIKGYYLRNSWHM